MSNKKYTYKQKQELNVWYNGSAPKILEFYSLNSAHRTLLGGTKNSNSTIGSTGAFWIDSISDTELGRRIATGFGRIISDSIALLLSNGGINIEKSEGDSTTEENVKQLEDVLKQWNDKLNFAVLEQAYSKTQAWQKATILLNFETEISGVVKPDTVKLVSPDESLVTTHEKEIHILGEKTYRNKGVNTLAQYKILEKRGAGYIKFEAVKFNTQTEDWNVVPPNDFIRITGENIPKSISFNVKIKTYTTFVLGVSNFEKSLQQMDKMDEYESREVDSARESDPITVWPESMIPENTGGIRNARKKRHMMASKAGRGDSAKDEIKFFEKPFNADKYPALKEKVRESIILTFGVDRYMLGLGSETRVEGEGLATKREQHTSRTISSMIEKFTPSLNAIFNIWNYFMNETVKVEFILDASKEILGEDISDEAEYKVTFRDPFTPTDEQEQEKWHAMYQAGGVDLKNYLTKLHEKTMSEEQIAEMYERKKAELGIEIEEDTINSKDENEADEELEKTGMMSKLFGKKDKKDKEESDDKEEK